jgi:hypothetical protein
MLEESPLISDTTPHNPLQSALLSSLMSGQSGGLDLQSLLAAQVGGDQSNELDLVSLLAAQGGNKGDLDDDRLNIMLRWLEQRRATATQTEPVEEVPSAAEIELERLEEMRQKRERQEEKRAQEQELKKVMDSMYAELETLRARNDTLAEALGACYLCFGEDLTCPECNGNGVPGSLLPNESAFRKYVAPAVNRVRAAKTKTSGSTSPCTSKKYQPQGDQIFPDSSQPVSTR